MSSRASTVAPPPSRLILTEAYKSASPKLLEELLERSWPVSANEHAWLRDLAGRWYADPRPEMRELLKRYVRAGADRVGQRPLVKGLFKRAEAAGDDELVGLFAVAFDRLLGRTVKVRTMWGFDPQTRQYQRVERRRLASPYNRVRRIGRKSKHAMSLPVFTTATRQYLARRALRYFRTLGEKHPQRFVPAVGALLASYEAEHLARPEQLLDAWSLLHLCYYRSPVLTWDPRALRVSPGRTLTELTPAPLHAALWQGQSEALLDLVLGARSHTVRQWAAALLQRDFADALRALPFARLRALLLSPHEPAQRLAAAFFADAAGLAALPVDAWFELLAVEDPLALTVVCEQFEKCVRPDRLSLERCVALACARPSPLAALGARWLRARVVQAPNAADLAALLPVARAACAPVRTELAPWLAAHVLRSSAASWQTVRDLLDAPFAEVRAAALPLLSEPRFADETGLWSALAESPYDDARGFLVQHLDARLPLLGADAARFVWATTLLAVHRGGRARAQVIAQLARQLERHPTEAGELLPLLRVALRSVRAPERRAALAALTRATLHAPSLREALARELPELELFALEPAAAVQGSSS